MTDPHEPSMEATKQDLHDRYEHSLYFWFKAENMRWCHLYGAYHQNEIPCEDQSYEPAQPAISAEGA